MIKSFVRIYIISVGMVAFLAGTFLGITGGSPEDFWTVMKGALVGAALTSGVIVLMARYLQ